MSEERRRAGRGLVFISAAKMYFILAGYAVQLVLPRVLGSAKAFGLYSTAMNVVSILNNVLIVTTVQTVSKMVSEDEQAANGVIRQGLRIQAGVGASLAVALYVAAPALAELVLLDEELTPLLQVASLVLLIYSLYGVAVGALNGQRRFEKQAGLDACFSTLRLVGILGGAWLGARLLEGLGGGPLGAVAGFTTAASIILAIALAFVGIGGGADRVSMRRWIAFMAPLGVYQFCLNGTLQVDLAVLKRTVAELAREQGAAAVIAAEMASRYAGFYRAAQTFAFVPYQLVLAVTFVVFPTVSRSVARGETEETRETIRRAMRFTFLLSLAVAAPIAGASDGVMRIAYPDEYLAGSGALSILVFGIAAFALFVVAATVLGGGGRPGLAATIAGVAVVMVVGANYTLVRWVGLGSATLQAAASGTSVATTLACLVAGWATFRAFGAFLPLSAVLRGFLAGAVAFASARSLPHGTAMGALLALALGFGAFLAMLAVLREVRPQELRALASVFGRKGR